MSSSETRVTFGRAPGGPSRRFGPLHRSSGPARSIMRRPKIYTRHLALAQANTSLTQDISNTLQHSVRPSTAMKAISPVPKAPTVLSIYRIYVVITLYVFVYVYRPTQEFNIQYIYSIYHILDKLLLDYAVSRHNVTLQLPINNRRPNQTDQTSIIAFFSVDPAYYVRSKLESSDTKRYSFPSFLSPTKSHG
ncbi:hypothetical protein DFH05DRAFT_815720 [Lentinula detonsa]|uniref:Transmembrane protein n=1 Tax=Lentinula detonsa TaxID=2804962 RepID=A0A9W8P5W9_9AGAR|nr:hypothetical protein DFH05DRAFT_815720 [Lentinula detonsa]